MSEHSSDGTERPSKCRVQGIDTDKSKLEEYDPDASGMVLTTCPGCGGVICVFQDGSVAQFRTRPIPSGVFVSSLSGGGFERHDCPSKPGMYACSHCGDRYDETSEADRCCRDLSCDYPVKYYRVLGAKPKSTETTEQDKIARDHGGNVRRVPAGTDRSGGVEDDD